jgi:hypothetical protein
VESYADRLVTLLGVAGQRVDCSWDSVEERIGGSIPGDYKEFVGHTGSAVLDDQLTVFAPNESDEVDIASFVETRTWAWEYLRAGGVEMPERFFVEGRRLIAFAAVEANYFYWDARDGVAPEDWGVVLVDGDLQHWFEFDMTATECLYMILVGEITPDPFAGMFGGAEHSVGRFGA